MSRATNKVVEVKQDPSGKHLCSFCGMGTNALAKDRLLKSGKFYQMGQHYFHYFCVLFSRDGVQRGADDEGLFGFLLADIEKELKRGSKLKCSFCSKFKSTVHCARAGCKAQYHFPCGNRRKCVFVFKDVMKSFCDRHAPRQTRKVRVADKTCLAGCSEKTLDSQRCLVSPCCGRRYHVACVQEMALQSGRAHFKCPVCSDKADFLTEALNFGIYVPEQDASWEEVELEDFYNFSAMGRLHQRCDAVSCVCPKGREYHMTGTDFETIRCHYCGCKAVHIKCGGLDKSKPDFICDQHDSSNRDQAVAPASKKSRQSSSSSSSSNDFDSPPSDSDTSIDDDIIEAKMNQDASNSGSSSSHSVVQVLVQPRLDSSPSVTVGEEEADDDIVIVNEVRGSCNVAQQSQNPLLRVLQPAVPSLRDLQLAKQIRRTNSIARLLSDVSAAANCSDGGKSKAPSTASSARMLDACPPPTLPYRTAKSTPASAVPQLKVVAFDSCRVGISHDGGNTPNLQLVTLLPGRQHPGEAANTDLASFSRQYGTPLSPCVIDLESSDDDCIQID